MTEIYDVEYYKDYRCVDYMADPKVCTKAEWVLLMREASSRKDRDVRIDIIGGVSRLMINDMGEMGMCLTNDLAAFRRGSISVREWLEMTGAGAADSGTESGSD